MTKQPESSKNGTAGVSLQQRLENLKAQRQNIQVIALKLDGAIEVVESMLKDEKPLPKPEEA